MTEAGLVLEGGATRGVFTSGALDYLMEKDLYFSYVVGVSAGSCNAVDYVSKQIGRTRDCMIHRGKEYSYYYGLKDFVKERSLLDMDMIFNKYPNELFPFDFDTYFSNGMTCEIVTTNCLTGNAEYMTEENDSDPADEDLPCQQQYATCMSDRKYRRDSVSGWWTCRFHSGKACAGKGTEKNSSHFDETGRLPQKTNFQSGR